MKENEALENGIYTYGEEFTSFFRGKRVFITGISGFKGSWMLKVLSLAGAVVTGYSLEPPTEPSLFEVIGGDSLCNFVAGDVRDLEALKKAFFAARPEIVIHMAAQPLVRESYKDPVYTYETNVIGTVNVLECVRLSDTVKAFVNVTTDKVYRNLEREEGYREDEVLDGYDPYSNSKSCSELVTGTYKRSFFSGKAVAVSTVRAGNVIGGGDFAKDRIIPDCVRAAEHGDPVGIRNPYSVRPYQHVLEPVFAYLMIAKETCEHPELAGSYNVGPDYSDCVETGRLVDVFNKCWGLNGGAFEYDPEFKPHEAGLLRLDCAKIKNVFGWRPRWNYEKAVAKVVEWSKVYMECGGSFEEGSKIPCGRAALSDVSDVMEKQIAEFCAAV
ncbi:MAG: CDP-glucose 4,6-dehydratase [Clostridia bacterium]|nr:CDP-glucose 4,6-dehydratase [Clostridia bacterium]